MTMHQHSSHLPHLSHPPSPSLVSVLLLCLCLVASLPSSFALPSYNGRSNSNSHRRTNPSNAAPLSSDAPSPIVGPSVVDAQVDLTPNSHLSHNTPHIPSIPSIPSTTDTDTLTPPSRSDAQQPSRIRAHPTATNLYSQQRRITRPQTQHVHDPAEEVPIDDPLAPAPVTTLPPQPETAHTVGALECLSAEQLAKAKKQARGALLSVMEKYLSAWQAEEKSESEVEALYEAKKEELKVKLTEKKQQLIDRACPGVARQGDSSDKAERSEVSSRGGGGKRRLLGLDEDDWLDQEEDKVYLIDEGESSASLSSDDDTGAVARIVAGGARVEESSADDEDGPRFDASIHPFGMPSAFTSLSERDIEALHSPPPAAPQPKPRPVSPVVEHHTDDDGEIGFIASISPARYSPAPLDNPPVIVVGQRSQRDMDEDLEEERRKRRERLRIIRSRSPAVASDSLSEASQPVARGSLPLSDEQLPPGGFVASISPMAPQRASVMEEGDEESEAAGGSSYVGSIGSISAPSIKSTPRGGGGGVSLEDRWRREQEEERKAEEGGGVWRSGSRGRLERVFTSNRQE